MAAGGLQRDRALRARVARRLAAALEPLEVSSVAAQATVVDDNGPRGGIALRCVLTVRLPYRPAARVEHVAKEARMAFDGAFAVLERRLKKYYAARRALG